MVNKTRLIFPRINGPNITLSRILTWMLSFERAIWISRQPRCTGVSIDGVDIPLFFNSLGVFAESIVL